MARSDANPITGLTWDGATKSPVNAVKMTSNMTRGLRSAK
jgi:hypothetical protein